MSDFDTTVQNAIANAGVALPSSDSTTFNLSNANLNSVSSGGSSSTLLGGLNTTSAQTSSTAALYGTTITTAGSTNFTSQFTSAASSAIGKLTGAVSSALGGSTSGSTASDAVDFRVRLRAQSGAADRVYGTQGSANILSILHETNGMFFPYTPTISWSQAVEYTNTSLVHSNQDYYAYKNTPSTQIDIQGQFTFQNQREGEYMLASMHLLRTVSKMYFGQSNPSLSGLPPPVLLLSGYGNYMFNDLPVIVKSHSYSLDNTVDYVTVNTAGGSARLPSIINISISLIVQHTPQDQRKNFDLDQFRTGALMRGKSKGWI